LREGKAGYKSNDSRELAPSTQKPPNFTTPPETVAENTDRIKKEERRESKPVSSTAAPHPKGEIHKRCAIKPEKKRPAKKKTGKGDKRKKTEVWRGMKIFRQVVTSSTAASSETEDAKWADQKENN